MQQKISEIKNEINANALLLKNLISKHPKALQQG